MGILLLPLIIGFIWLFFAWFAGPTSRQTVQGVNGKVSDIPHCVDLFLQTNLGNPELSFQITRRVTELKIRLGDHAAYIELPLRTASQKKQRNDYLKFCQSLDKTVYIKALSNGNEVLCISTDKTDKLGDLTSRLFCKFFKVDNTRKIHITSTGLAMDVKTLARYGNTLKGVKVLESLPSVIHEKASLHTLKYAQLKFPLRALIIPTVYVGVFHVLGLTAYCIALFVGWVLFGLMGLYPSNKTILAEGHYYKLVYPFFIGATLYQHNPEILQIYLSLIFGLLLALICFSPVTKDFGLRHWGKQNSEILKSHKGLMYGTIGCILIVALMINEYFRISGSFEHWLLFNHFWFILFMPFVASILPIILVASGKYPKDSQAL